MNWYKKSQYDPEYPLEDPPLYGDSNYKSTGGKIVYMSPDEYLSKVNIPLTLDGVLDDASRDNVDALVEHMVEGRKLDPPILRYYNNKVIDHDGRHRAIAAKELGIKSMPVLITIED